MCEDRIMQGKFEPASFPYLPCYVEVHTYHANHQLEGDGGNLFEMFNLLYEEGEGLMVYFGVSYNILL